MKFKLKDDIWGIVFATGVGVLSWMIYDIGKSTGGKQAYEEQNAWLNALLEEAEKAHTEQ